ncbi:uncharacterized protein BYT42DRAFT_30796 [Radiomyces spectabilis]|uniref:uncharacterized protein n=1 Tax=Radiomyces spectabilis TaxID=64574 RepID=UPI00221F04B2|nr:uncharacterized protein BYT42DRAFT_30796 [Radiomyces spectabilis]KAI8394100.1 hypothetical protein BYT42DRAFT_30796 [Radiomyces spectabilis]
MLLPKKNAVVDDDEFKSGSRHVQAPTFCVDYLSYNFDEMDLAASWRALTRQKNDIANGIRLENASWRTWAKQKNQLKTISPETLNWLKDSDVTWLYGPLHTVIKEDRYSRPKVATTEDTLGLMTNSQRTEKRQDKVEPSVEQTNTSENAQSNFHRTPLKSALKRVTLSDILRRSASELQVSKLGDNMAGPASDRYNSLFNDPNTLTEANKQLGAFSPSVIATHRQPKLRFNQYVEQRVTLNHGDDRRRTSARLRYNMQPNLYEEDTSSDSDEEENDGKSLVIQSSMKKIAPARLKSSSHSEHETDPEDDVSMMSTPKGKSSRRRTSLSGHVLRAEAQRRRDSKSSWEDGDQDSSSDEEDEMIPSSAAPWPSGTAIQWEGQACIYDTVPPIRPEDFNQHNSQEEDDRWSVYSGQPSGIYTQTNAVTTPPSPINHANVSTDPSSPTSYFDTLSRPSPRSARSSSSSGLPSPHSPRSPGHPVNAKCEATSQRFPIDADAPSLTQTSSYHSVSEMQRVGHQRHHGLLNQMKNWVSSLWWSDSR